ncbi:hypothetical protein BDW02DRAFT_607394 [Decorospora gaudefroyi]|uniref:RING-type domain-containing protein n=1 Tax=Decorospora gaudefroyi TaxID=184978 RepID=A0A6A5K2M2_9PLEO|nr:hypothetical protein BDW02DRAFT_607394 [Decorospora gaudefroyi]
MTSQPEALPSRREFFNNIVVVERCGICMGPFDGTHQPAHIKSGKCEHTFGITCIRKWAESDQANSHMCPLCREVLFVRPKKPNFQPSGVRGHDNGTIWIHGLCTHDRAKAFVRSMWTVLWGLFQDDYQQNGIFDSDIEEHINRALNDLTDESYHSGLHILSEHWPGIRSVARCMIVKHYENGYYCGCGGEDLEKVWMPAISAVLEWELHSAPGEDDEDDEDDGYDIYG